MRPCLYIFVSTRGPVCSPWVLLMPLWPCWHLCVHRLLCSRFNEFTAPVQRHTHCLSSLLHWYPVSFTECPLALILQVWVNGLCIHLIHHLHDFETLHHIPLSLHLPKPRVPAFFISTLTIYLPVVTFSLTPWHPSGDAALHQLWHLVLSMRAHPTFP